QQIVVDVDLKNVAQSRDEVLDCAINKLALRPSQIVDSGYGLHLKWFLKEPLVDSAGMERAELTMRRLVRLLAGDPAPTSGASVLRCVGSHNSKLAGERRECKVIWGIGAT